MRTDRSQKTPFMKIRKVFRPESLDEKDNEEFWIMVCDVVLSVVSSMVVLCACFQRLLVFVTGILPSGLQHCM